MTNTITFGQLTFDLTRDVPIIAGVSGNTPYNYSTEVRYHHVEPHVNITRTREPNGTSHPVKGALVEGVPVTVVAQSEGATLHAVKKRCDHKPNAEVGPMFIEGHNALMDIVHEREEIRLDRDAICAYLDEMSGEKRERLGVLLDSLDFTLPGYTDKVVFAKSEALLKPDGSQPRVVYQGGDMYNLVMGSVVYYLSRRIAEELSRSNPKNKGNEILYCVGMTADEIADLVHHTPGQPLENDFKNNDGTQPGGVRKHEAMFYYKLGAPKWFVREFATNTSVRIFTRYGVRGRVNGQRWSGEVTTTTGNGYVNSCISLAALKRSGAKKTTTFVYGDDNLTYVADDNTRAIYDLADSFEEVALDTGMKAEVLKPRHREAATFLRKRFAPSIRKTFPVPSFGRVIAKLPIRANYNPAVSDEDYMAGKLLSAAYEHRHIASIRSILLETAEKLSPSPYMDFRNQAMAYKFTPAEMRELTVNSDVIEADHFGSFLQNVYGIWENELIDVYTSVCDGILGFQRVNAKHSRQPRGKPPLAPLIPRALWDTKFESLINIDVTA